MAVDPIHQFQIIDLFPVGKIGNTEIAFTNSAAYMVAAVVIITAFLLVGTARRSLVPGRVQSAAELTYEFVANTIQSTAGTEGMRFFPQFLRDAGYYCTNNSKEDYNLETPAGGAWDESSTTAHWKHRAANQPFFAVFNSLVSHESQLRAKRALVHDPSKVRVPAYHPDTPEVRHDWAQYYDNITAMDRQVGELLRELEEAGLAEDTIIIFYSDHGSGMPRHKRWPGDSGRNCCSCTWLTAGWRGTSQD